MFVEEKCALCFGQVERGKYRTVTVIGLRGKRMEFCAFNTGGKKYQNNGTERREESTNEERSGTKTMRAGGSNATVPTTVRSEFGISSVIGTYKMRHCDLEIGDCDFRG